MQDLWDNLAAVADILNLHNWRQEELPGYHNNNWRLWLWWNYVTEGWISTKISPFSAMTTEWGTGRASVKIPPDWKIAASFLLGTILHSTCKDILHHVCIRLSPKTSRCEDDSVCSTVLYVRVSTACHLEPLLCLLHLQPLYHRCLQSENTFINNHITHYTRQTYMQKNHCTVNVILFMRF